MYTWTDYHPRTQKYEIVDFDRTIKMVPKKSKILKPSHIDICGHVKHIMDPYYYAESQIFQQTICFSINDEKKTDRRPFIHSDDNFRFYRHW